MPRTEKGTYSLPVFEQRLKALMKEQGWKGRTLAAEIGVHETAVSHWVRGNAVPCVGRMMRLARVFGVDLHYLSGWSERRPDHQLGKIATRLERSLAEVRAELGVVQRRRKAVAP